MHTIEVKQSKELKEHIAKATMLKGRSKIFCIVRNYDPANKKYNGIKDNELILNGGMSCFQSDMPYSYMCNIFGYEITMYSQTPEISVYKKKMIKDIPCLNYYFYRSDHAPDIFENQEKELITQEKLCMIANRDWAEYDRFIKTKRNIKFMQEMKRKYIKYMEFNEQIIYSVEKKKYIPFDLNKFYKEYKKE